MINKNPISRNRFIHLYNPKKEGLGSYDINYVNAYKKKKHFEANGVKPTDEELEKMHKLKIDKELERIL